MNQTKSGFLPRTLKSLSIRRAQRVHAMAVAFLILIGFCLAVFLTVYGHPPGIAEIASMIVFYLISTIGIAVGFHRLFTHQSFKASNLVTGALCIMGSMAMQGTPNFWVSLHRRHHEHSDKAGDPHSPYVLENGEVLQNKWQGFWHSYFSWTLAHEVPNTAFYARDLMRNLIVAWVNRHYFVWVGFGFLLPTLVGGIVHGTYLGALNGLVWGGLIRLFLSHNMIWSITSVTHLWGASDLDSRDQSRNNPWLALFTLGESWHNNHHAFPRAATLNFRWYQIDLSGALIKLLEQVGLIWDVHRPTHAAIADKTFSTKNQPTKET